MRSIFKRKYLLKYIEIVKYVLKTCFNQTKSRNILNVLLHNLRFKILFGLEVSFQCVPDNILEKLLTSCYDNKSIIKYSLQIHKCLFVSPETLNKLELNNMQWILVNTKTKDSNRLPMLHHNRIVVLNNFKESECLLTSTNLFNICDHNHSCQVTTIRIVKPLINIQPKVTQKASISVVKPVGFNDTPDEQILLDKALSNYFSLPKFVSTDDVIKLDFIKCYPEAEYLLKPLKTSIFYIKIIELEGRNTLMSLYNCKNNFYISNVLSKLNEVKLLSSTYLPNEKVCAINNLKGLNTNNFKNYMLNIFPGGMNADGELLVSWIKPFIQHKQSGDINLVLHLCLF